MATGYRRTTYTNPERLRLSEDERGRVVQERIPQHPTRPAYPWEVNTWLERPANHVEQQQCPQTPSKRN